MSREEPGFPGSFCFPTIRAVDPNPFQQMRVICTIVFFRNSGYNRVSGSSRMQPVLAVIQSKGGEQHVSSTRRGPRLGRVRVDPGTSRIGSDSYPGCFGSTDRERL